MKLHRPAADVGGLVPVDHMNRGAGTCQTRRDRPAYASRPAGYDCASFVKIQLHGDSPCRSSKYVL
jgi:hypothetical protein